MHKLTTQETKDEISLMAQKKDKSLFASIPMNKKHKIDSFEMIGMTDPVNSKPERPIKWLRQLNIESRVYPLEAYEENDEAPPYCIFVPETTILNKMIETCAKYPNDPELIFSKFSCLDQPKPQWLLDEETV